MWCSVEDVQAFNYRAAEVEKSFEPQRFGVFPLCHNFSSASGGLEHEKHLTEPADPHYEGSPRQCTLHIISHLYLLHLHIKIKYSSVAVVVFSV